MVLAKQTDNLTQASAALENDGEGMRPASAKSSNQRYRVPVIENAPQNHAPHAVDDPLHNWRRPTPIPVVSQKPTFAPAQLRTETFKDTAAALEQHHRMEPPAAKASTNLEYQPAESIEDNHG